MRPAGAGIAAVFSSHWWALRAAGSMPPSSVSMHAHYAFQPANMNQGSATNAGQLVMQLHARSSDVLFAEVTRFSYASESCNLTGAGGLRNVPPV